jgi:hypothetical protein
MSTRKPGNEIPPAHADANPSFTSIIDLFAADRSVGLGRMFGAEGLKVNGKVFAMLVKGSLVVKLPKQRVDDIVGSTVGVPFDPGHGRPMKEWIVIGLDRKDRWPALAKEARSFVGDR